MLSSASSKPKSKDITWEHCFCTTLENRSKITWKHCLKVLHGITRVKNHLAGIPKDVAPCQSVPDNVRKLIHSVVIAKTKQKEQRVEEACRLRATINLSHSEGEKLDDDGAQDNGIKIVRKKSVGVGPLDSFCKLTPEEARKRGPKETSQSTITTKKQEEMRDHACEYIAQWFYEASIPHNTATLPSFDRMLEDIGEYG
ncbi:hypothetical protein LUZ63_007515 [Rhynchospora breviuscula]|uniref:Uncharacterized protein n=1 Tax=Rhynchospora breviuscula TaxID=2022672 RepID=A0A9Q0CS70_9POAL|nr:hypothetical protein LUZ63_007515 [Rhynchospora breviuscula]